MEKYIKSILVSGQRAIINNFGTIEVMKEENGKYSFSFNPYLRYDDGKIKSLMAEDKGISQDEASLALDRLVDSYNNALQDGEKVVLKGVGTFFKDEDGRVAFEPDPNFPNSDDDDTSSSSSSSDDNNSEAATAAATTTAVATAAQDSDDDSKLDIVEDEKEEQKEDTKDEEQKDSEETSSSESTSSEQTKTYKEEKSSSKKWLVILLILVLILLIVIILFRSCGSKEEEQAPAPAQTEAPADTVVTEPEPAPVQEAPKLEPAKEKPSPTVARPLEKRYNIIVGSYKNESDAIRRVEDLQKKGFADSFVGMRKNYFVAVIGAFSSISQAEAMQEEIVDGQYHIESWITNSGEYGK